MNINDFIILGIYRDGYFNEKGLIYYENGSLYKGNLVNSIKNGKGIEQSPTFFYEGNFVNNKKDGLGHIKFKLTNEEYNGEFKDDQIHGKGIYVFSNKNSYNGSFENGKMHGKGGIFKWVDGAEYHGEYINNIKEGKGKFKWKDGRVFEGPFVQGKMHGIGKFTYKNVTYEAEFFEGTLKKNKENRLSRSKSPDIVKIKAN